MAIRVRAELNHAQYGFRFEDVRIEMQLKSQAGDEILRRVSATPEQAIVELSIKADLNLGPGDYVVCVRLVHRVGGAVLGETTHPLRVYAERPRPKVWFDEHRRLIVDDKPFFPLGMCLLTINERDLRIYSTSKFNYILPLAQPGEEEMAVAHRYRLKVGLTIMHHFDEEVGTHERLVRESVKRFRDHPALLNWFMADEPASHRVSPTRVASQQRWVEEEDPDHPTSLTMMHPERVYEFMRGADAIGTDPYPLPDRPIAMAGEWTRRTASQVLHARPVWMVPQAFSFAAYPKTPRNHHTPTLKEMRCMAWQCICEGATGICFYSFFDLKRDPQTPFDVQWRRCKQVASEISDLIPVILSIESVPRIQVDKRRWLNWMARSHRGWLYLFAVNHGTDAGTFRCQLPPQYRVADVLGEKRKIILDDGILSDVLHATDVRVYVVCR